MEIPKVPDKVVEKAMLSETLRLAVKYIMENHTWIYETTRKQARGGPIGLELTGEIAAILMMWWDRELLKRTRRLGLEVIQGYVDDINLVVKLPLERRKLIRDSDGEYKLEIDHDSQEEEEDILYIYWHNPGGGKYDSPIHTIRKGLSFFT